MSKPETVTVQNSYPCPVLANFPEETPDGETTVRQITLLPGEVKKVDREDWESLKSNDAIVRALDDRRMFEDPDDQQIERNRRRLGRSLLDPELINHFSEVARTTDVREDIAQEDEQDAMRAIRDYIAQSGGRRTRRG